MLFDSWTALGQTLLTALLAYVALVFLLRISGKRTLSKWNAFDFIVTIALGSTLATVILSNEVTVVQGVLAFVLLVGAQFVVTWLSVRSRFVRRVIKAEPVLLVYEGQLQREAMHRERVPEAEVLAALRGRGLASVGEAAAVTLETDGTFSVIERLHSGSNSTLAGVAGYAEKRRTEGKPCGDLPVST